MVAALACSSFADDAPAAERLLADGHPEAAIKALQPRAAADSTSGADWHVLSRAYLSAQKWDLAISAGEKAISLGPQIAQYHLWLGRAYGEKADHISSFNFVGAIKLARKTRAEFERTVALEPDNVAALSEIGRA